MFGSIRIWFSDRTQKIHLGFTIFRTTWVQIDLVLLEFLDFIYLLRYVYQKD